MNTGFTLRQLWQRPVLVSFLLLTAHCSLLTNRSLLPNRSLLTR